MKIFEKFMRSNKLNNRRLFYLLSVFALFGIVSLFVWQPSAEMQDKNESEWRIQNIKGDISPNDAVPATRIPSITVSTNMGSGFGTNIQNTVNGVGLSSLSLTATHAATIPPNSWVSATGQLTGTVTFNLGGIFTVDSFSFWNQNGGGPGANGSTGIQGVAVSTSTDGITFTPLSGGPTSFAQVTANANVPPQIFNFTPVSAGFFRFTIQSNYGDSARTGFAEVGFNAVSGNVCTPSATVTEGDLFPGGIVSFGVSTGPGSVTVDHVNAGTGLQSLTVVDAPVNAVVNIPAFPAGTFNPVVVTFTPINPALPVSFRLRAASQFHAAFIDVHCVITTPTPTPPIP